ncbi:MAG: hypothetical protein EWV40_13635 [Microcystis flos-aquae Mf_WU_F_19750830_S460]|uniref:Uncharacterized protein n=1 Tax=Microcystis flos-aquae Mf_WU_F_19750830_S460 TaxID=2486237 RepID=A0A552LJF1_9CHRO|nr:MAG: hypothetical protein EWV40_13635 [Microcystis flos-aquae Mf_WU_F_19750830_S460]
MKKFSPPQMKEVPFPTPHTLFQVRSQYSGDRRLFYLFSLLPTPHTPHPTPHTLHPLSSQSFCRA